MSCFNSLPTFWKDGGTPAKSPVKRVSDLAETTVLTCCSVDTSPLMSGSHLIRRRTCCPYIFFFDIIYSALEQIQDSVVRHWPPVAIH
jgi:hypothetical protein